MYSCVQDGIIGFGCISSDPCFVDSENGDFHLNPNSKCIDAGNYAYHMLSLAGDLDGNTRLAGPQIDRGCYETGTNPDSDGDWLADYLEPGF